MTTLWSGRFDQAPDAAAFDDTPAIRRARRDVQGCKPECKDAEHEGKRDPPHPAQTRRFIAIDRAIHVERNRLVIELLERVPCP